MLTSIRSVAARFLGAEHWRSLYCAVRQESQRHRECVGGKELFAALLIGLTPPAITAVGALAEGQNVYLPTVAFGIATLLALLVRRRIGLREPASVKWRQSFRLTHTAVAMGCIPAVFVIIFSWRELVDRRQMLVTTALPAGGEGSSGVALVMSLLLLVAFAGWAAVTEEYIYRGLLLAVMRRALRFRKQLASDLTAVVITSLLFGGAHYPIWGLPASIALSGLGVGFGIAFIATGERLLPLIVYHLLFDLMSMFASFF